METLTLWLKGGGGMLQLLLQSFLTLFVIFGEANINTNKFLKHANNIRLKTADHIAVSPKPLLTFCLQQATQYFLFKNSCYFTVLVLSLEVL